MLKYMKFIFLIISFSFPLLLFAQKSDAQLMKYTRYEGAINKSIGITANIIRMNGQLSGNYQYSFIENNSDMYYGKTIELTGNIFKGDSARLKEFGRNQYAFYGIMAADSFAGTWNAPDNKKLPFLMKEFFPKGTMPFTVFHLKSTKKLDPEKNNSPTTEIELTLLFPDNYLVPAVSDSVKKIISNSFFGPGFSAEEPNKMLVEFKNENWNNYLKQNEEWDKQGVSFSWEQLQSMSVTYNSNYLLCLEYLKYAFTGGAHGMSNISYDIIYLQTGELLTYSDIFKENIDDTLSVLLTNQLRKDYHIPADLPLSEAGFFVDSIEPNRNIYVTGNGIGFLFNSYEIAPYSTGATNIFVEFGQIKNLIKQGTPVYNMSRH